VLFFLFTICAPSINADVVGIYNNNTLKLKGHFEIHWRCVPKFNETDDSVLILQVPMG
jgi:hypothetical protein